MFDYIKLQLRIAAVIPRRIIVDIPFSVAGGLALALAAWAWGTTGFVKIAALHSPEAGLALIVAGSIFCFPFAKRWLPCPVMTGFCAMCIGVSIACGSASGLWLVSPMLLLGCAAVGGVFGTLPDDSEETPTTSDYARFFLFMVLPWLALYEAILFIGIPPDAISGVTRFEERLPVMEWTQVFYGSVYVVVLSVPFFAKTRRDLRWFSVRGLWSMLIAYPAFLAIPLIAPKRAFVAHSVPGQLLDWERSMDSPVAAFPSFHVIWVLLAAEVYSRRWPRWRWTFFGWAMLVSASCVTTSQHSILDVLGGFATVALVVRARRMPAFHTVWMILTAVAVGRLWMLHAPFPLVGGVGLILAGFSAVRRSPGIAAMLVAAGVILTCLPQGISGAVLL